MARTPVRGGRRQLARREGTSSIPVNTDLRMPDPVEPIVDRTPIQAENIQSRFDAVHVGPLEDVPVFYSPQSAMPSETYSVVGDAIDRVLAPKWQEKLEEKERKRQEEDEQAREFGYTEYIEGRDIKGSMPVDATPRQQKAMIEGFNNQKSIDIQNKLEQDLVTRTKLYKGNSNQFVRDANKYLLSQLKTYKELPYENKKAIRENVRSFINNTRAQMNLADRNAEVTKTLKASELNYKTLMNNITRQNDNNRQPDDQDIEQIESIIVDVGKINEQAGIDLAEQFKESMKESEARRLFNIAKAGGYVKAKQWLANFDTGNVTLSHNYDLDSEDAVTEPLVFDRATHDKLVRGFTTELNEQQQNINARRKADLAVIDQAAQIVASGQQLSSEQQRQINEVIVNTPNAALYMKSAELVGADVRQAMSGDATDLEIAMARMDSRINPANIDLRPEYELTKEQQLARQNDQELMKLNSNGIEALQKYKTDLKEKPFETLGIPFGEIADEKEARTIFNKIKAKTGMNTVQAPAEFMAEYKRTRQQSVGAGIIYMQDTMQRLGTDLFNEAVMPQLTGTDEYVRGAILNMIPTSEAVATVTAIEQGKLLKAQYDSRAKRDLSEGVNTAFGRNIPTGDTVDNVSALAIKMANESGGSPEDYIKESIKTITYGQKIFNVDGQSLTSLSDINAERISDIRTRIKENPSAVGLFTFDPDRSTLAVKGAAVYETYRGQIIEDSHGNPIGYTADGKLIGHSNAAENQFAQYDGENVVNITDKMVKPIDPVIRTDQLAQAIPNDELKVQVDNISRQLQSDGQLYKHQWQTLEDTVPGFKIEGSRQNNSILREVREKTINRIISSGYHMTNQIGSPMSILDVARDLTEKLNKQVLSDNPGSFTFHGIEVNMPSINYKRPKKKKIAVPTLKQFSANPTDEVSP